MNNRGFSFIELLGSLAISSCLSVVVTLLLLNQPFSIEGVKYLFLAFDEKVSSGDILEKDFDGSFNSFNKLFLKDSKGRNFWDYFPDYPEKLIRNSRREYILKPGSEFLLSTVDVDFPDLLMLPPEKMYIGDQAIAGSKRKGFKFGSVNEGGFLSNQIHSRGSQKEDFWKSGRTLLFFSPVLSRRVNRLGQKNFRSSPRSHFVFAQIAGLVVDATPRSGISLVAGGADRYGNKNLTVDEYLRSLPVVDGVSPSFVRAVDFVSYRIENIAGVRSLVRLSWGRNGGYKSFFRDDLNFDIIAQGINEVRFYRSSVSKTKIDIHIL